MKRLLVALVAVVALAAPVAASAHPLGNFTVNRYSELDVAGNRLYVVYVLDLAEIPTFQAGGRRGIHADAYAPPDRGEPAPDGRRPARAARAGAQRARVPAGPGRPDDDAARGAARRADAAGAAAQLAYRDGNYAGRIGWKEIVVSPSARRAT